MFECRQRRVGGTAALIGMLLLLAHPVRADEERTPFVLPRSGTEVHWSGVVPQGVVGDPALCTPMTCTTDAVRLDRPAERLVIAIDTSDVENSFDPGYDVRLHVFAPDGTLAGSDDSSFEGNVVVLDDAPAGVWKVRVVPDQVVGHLPYRAYAASTTAPPSRGPVRDLLPNLVAVPPRNLVVATAPIAGPPPAFWDFRGMATGPASCYAQEIAEQGARRCLRFDQTVANLGTGPLELRARQLGDGPMDQRVHRSDGSVRSREVGDVQLHLQHLHFHYEQYAQVRLHNWTARGRRGPLVRESRKQGFCLADVHNMRFGRPDQVRPAYVDPETCDGRDEAPGFSRVGLSPGWADTYPWFLLDQYLEITGVPDGRYVLDLVVNEAGALLESDLDDNVASVVFDLRGDDVSIVSTSTAAPASEWCQLVTERER